MTPWAPIAVAATVVAGAVAAWHFLWGGDGGEKPDDFVPPDDGSGDQAEDTIGPKPKPPGPSIPVCSRTGKPYDAARFGSPEQVAAYLVALGYGVGPTLVSPTDAAEIKLFQRRIRALGLPGLAGAGDKWIDGRMGPCSLVGLGAALDLHERGEWDLSKARGA